VKDEKGNPVINYIPEPPTNKIINRRTNILEKTLSLEEGVYVLVFDNRFSKINSKNTWLNIREIWGTFTPPVNLPIVEQLANDVPYDVAICITDANDCYTSGHYNQCSVMLRKTLEVSIKIKLQQSKIDTDEMIDKMGNELSLSKKIKLLRKHKLITQRSESDIEQIKWFGDIGAHSTMRVTMEDIKNVEPKIRSFLVGLSLIKNND
ncbi:MAG: DUF4145 domain-containing protein, partial [Patescibacteria group bacterium]|nr:DUF4145 domain-containing protein [Patescibacteria group bacterium]